ncbi:MAG: hypothetical protein M4D80_14310 [Myxococcota bacterium]|nr:hypothetical protein [Deltaproteobacteria bacterium]MDQ3336338.1 hypothetical protein [Myxococcota bacterium]
MLGWMLIAWRFVTVYAWLGGPLYVFDLIKNGDKDLQAIVICSLPTALMLVGSLGFNFEKRGRLLVRIGLFGSISMLLLDGFATVAYLLYWPGYRDQLLVMTGLGAGFVAALSFVVFARTYLGRPR